MYLLLGFFVEIWIMKKFSGVVIEECMVSKFVYVIFVLFGNWGLLVWFSVCLFCYRFFFFFNCCVGGGNKKGYYKNKC